MGAKPALPRHMDQLDTDAKNLLLENQLETIENRRRENDIHPLTTYEERRLKEGRPLAYANPEMLAFRINSYFEEIEEHNAKELKKKEKNVYHKLRLQTPHMLGLAVYLDIDIQTIMNYERKDDFSPVIRQAKRRCELGLANASLQGDNVATVAVLMLKNLHQWKDKQETDITTGGVPFTIARKTFIQPSSIDSIDGEVSDA